MSAPDLPDFERAIGLSQGNLDAAELAECHGAICGLICRQSAKTADDGLHHLAELHLVADSNPATQAVLVELFDSTEKQLADEDMGFSLWLPDDEEPLEERTIALAQWCTGFLAGLASGGQFEELSEEAAEALDDLQQIARAELTMQDSDEPENEDDEAALVEIIEYVRIVTLMMREEFRGPGSDDAIH